MSTTKFFHTGSDAVVDYIHQHSVRYTEAQKWLIEKTMTVKYCRMLGSGEQLQLLANLCKLMGAKKTLDIVVFTGYSALTIASALPDDGQVYALDITDEYLKDFCEPAWEKAGVRKKINFIAKPALETLNKLIDEGHSGTFDFAFIDADKPSYENYYEASLKLIQPNGVIAVDDVLWHGKVINQVDQSEITCAIRNFNEKLKDETRCNISMLQMGDGVTLAFKK